MPRTNPTTGNGRRPKAVKVPPSTTGPIAPTPTSPPTFPSPQPTAVTPTQSDATLQALTGLNFPDRLIANLPDFNQLTSVADIGSPASFDAAGWSRVTDAQRTEDARHYRELRNYASNVKDGVDTLIVMGQATIASTEFGKSLIRYATGVEGMRTEAVRFQLAQTETAIANSKLVGKAQELTYQNEQNRTNQTKFTQDIQFKDAANQAAARQYQADLDGLAAKLDATLRKNEADLLDTAHKYPAIAGR